MLERSGKENKIKAPVAQQTRTDVPVDEPEVGVVAEYTGGLLQFGKIDVDTGDPRAGDICQQVSEPAVAAAYFEDVQVCLFPGDIVNEPAGGLLSQLPFP